MTRFFNPCTLADRVTINVPTFTVENYYIYATEQPWIHPAFTVTTQPNTHTLCGPFSYSGFFSFVSADETTEPVKYFDAETKFTVFSENMALANTSDVYTVTATLANWPSRSETQNELLNFLDPCTNLFDFQPVPQNNPLDDEYTGANILFALTRFTVEPLVCEDTITYACTNVVGPDGNDYTAEMCAGFDGVFDGGVDDGKLTLSAILDQYVDGTRPAGLYTFTITGTPYGSQPAKTAEFTWFLIDPCSPPEALNVFP